MVFETSIVCRCAVVPFAPAVAVRRAIAVAEMEEVDHKSFLFQWIRNCEEYTYLLFVIFFTQTKFLENKIYTEKTRKLRQNTQ